MLSALQSPTAILLPPSQPHYPLLVAPRQQGTDNSGPEIERWEQSKDDDREGRDQMQEEGEEHRSG